MQNSFLSNLTHLFQKNLVFTLFMCSVCFTLLGQTPKQSDAEAQSKNHKRVQEERAQKAAFDCLYSSIKDSVKTVKLINEVKLKNKNLSQPQILLKISEYRDSLEKTKLIISPKQFDESTLMGKDFWTSEVKGGYETCYISFVFKKDKAYEIIPSTVDCAGIPFLESQGRWSLQGNILSMKWKVINFNTGHEEEVECKSTLNWVSNKIFKQKILSHPNNANIGKEREFLAEFLPPPPGKTCGACAGGGQISCPHYDGLPKDNSWTCSLCKNTGYYKCTACNGKGHH